MGAVMSEQTQGRGILSPLDKPRPPDVKERDVKREISSLSSTMWQSILSNCWRVRRDFSAS